MVSRTRFAPSRRRSVDHDFTDSLVLTRRFVFSPFAVLAHDPLRVSLADLLSADIKGKWWLVGAAWAGNPLVDHAKAAAQAPKTISLEVEEDDLMKLARKQGMNTDVRRRVFVVVMSSTVSLRWV